MEDLDGQVLDRETPGNRGTAAARDAEAAGDEETEGSRKEVALLAQGSSSRSSGAILAFCVAEGNFLHKLKSNLPNPHPLQPHSQPLHGQERPAWSFAGVDGFWRISRWKSGAFTGASALSRCYWRGSRRFIRRHRSSPLLRHTSTR